VYCARSFVPILKTSTHWAKRSARMAAESICAGRSSRKPKAPQEQAYHPTSTSSNGRPASRSISPTPRRQRALVKRRRQPDAPSLRM
jgi:hypothetical protein